MKKGQVFEGVIEKVAFPNKGHITVDGKTVIVKNGVPGQKVRFSVNKVRSGRAEGRILEVLEKSPLECEPVCPHFADCGGCTYQNLSYEDTLLVRDELAPLILPDNDEASAVRFDALMYGLELAQLAGRKYGRLKSDLFDKVGAIATVANIPEIQVQKELIEKILNTDYVERAGI